MPRVLAFWGYGGQLAVSTACTAATSAVATSLGMASTMSFLHSSTGGGGGVTVFFTGHSSSGLLIHSIPFW